jgi:hypothetical protein
MSARPIPHLRRDLPISIALLIMAAAAVVPGTIAVIIALAGVTGLMFFSLTRRRVVKPRRTLGSTRWKAQSFAVSESANVWFEPLRLMKRRRQGCWCSATHASEGVA